MINYIASGVHAADIATLRQARAKKTAPAQDGTAETGKPHKPAHPAHPHGHVPPGLARAAEKIASKIFERADADASGTVTREELSAVHSKHARILASSDLFQTNDTGTTPAEPVDGTEATTETVTEPETETETPVEAGRTEAQLKEALTRFFCAKVGVTYIPPAPPSITEPVDSTTPVTTTPPSTDDPLTKTSESTPTFIAVV